jgi:hypothetical protein
LNSSGITGGTIQHSDKNTDLWMWPFITVYVLYDWVCIPFYSHAVVIYTCSHRWQHCFRRNSEFQNPMLNDDVYFAILELQHLLCSQYWGKFGLKFWNALSPYHCPVNCISLIGSSH